MTDLALDLDDDGRSFAVLLYGGDLIRDDSLRTAVLASLFSDREATPEQLQAAGLAPDDRRGWWGDALASDASDRIGSHLWLLGRRRRTPALLPEAQRYAEAALAWLVQDRLASAVAVVARYGQDGELLLDVDLTRPSGREQYRLGMLWASSLGSSGIDIAREEAGKAAHAAAAIERVWYVEIPEITE